MNTEFRVAVVRDSNGDHHRVGTDDEPGVEADGLHGAAADLVAAVSRTLQPTEFADIGCADDVLIGSPGNDTLGSGPGNDRIECRGGNDVVDAGLGNNTIIC
jgi:Ca2+-binding RTX toxin-like protein